MSKAEKYEKELKDIQSDPEAYLNNRKVKIDLKWFLVTVLVAFVAGAVIF